MRKVIFLDIDGVLVNRKMLMQNRELRIGQQHNFDPDCVARFNQIIDAIKPMPFVVLSSTWRMSMALDEFGRFARKQEVYVPVLDITPIIYTGREIEIKAWLDQNKDVSHMAIIDDCPMTGMLSTYSVKTDTEIGLEDKHVEQAIKLLS